MAFAARDACLPSIATFVGVDLHSAAVSDQHVRCTTASSLFEQDKCKMCGADVSLDHRVSADHPPETKAAQHGWQMHKPDTLCKVMKADRFWCPNNDMTLLLPDWALLGCQSQISWLSSHDDRPSLFANAEPR